MNVSHVVIHIHTFASTSYPSLMPWDPQIERLLDLEKNFTKLSGTNWGQTITLRLTIHTFSRGERDVSETPCTTRRDNR